MYSKSFIFWNFLKIYIFVVYFVKALPPDEFEIKIVDRGHQHNVTVKADRNFFLANKNLPIWKMEGNNILPYTEMKDIMKKLGTITPYYNHQKQAAFLHSSSCNCLSGVIDVRYIITDLGMSSIYETHHTDTSKYVHYRRSKPSERPSSGLKEDSILTQYSGNLDATRTAEQLEMNKKAINKTLYPEILIVMKNDFYKYWTSSDGSTDDAKKILYTINLINAANMLYSTTKNPEVKLNIAGIIIESQENQLPPLPGGSSGKVLSADSMINEIIQSNFTFFEKFKLHPKMAFDWIFFLTSKALVYGSNKNLKRMTVYPKNGVVKARSIAGCNFIRPISIITDDYEYRSYPTIAHEVYHLINHGSHNKVETDSCHFEYLDEYDNPHFEKFQWSDDCCLLINKPQSLNFSQAIMALDEQCQCYSYDKHYYFDDSVCKESLICEDKENNELAAIKIVDDVACQRQWEKEKQRLTVSSPTTTTAIPLLQIKDQWNSISVRQLSSVTFIFPNSNAEDNDDGLVCLGITVLGTNENHPVAITAGSCTNQAIKMRNYFTKVNGSRITVVARADADFSLSKSSIDFDDEAALVYTNDEVSEEFLALSELPDSKTLKNSFPTGCHLINVTRKDNTNEPYTITFIPMDIVMEEKGANKYKIKSKNPINESDRGGMKGNPLFCKTNAGNTELVGVLVGNNADKSFRFLNIGDYKKDIQKKMNDIFSEE